MPMRRCTSAVLASRLYYKSFSRESAVILVIEHRCSASASSCRTGSWLFVHDAKAAKLDGTIYAVEIVRKDETSRGVKVHGRDRQAGGGAGQKGHERYRQSF